MVPSIVISLCHRLTLFFLLTMFSIAIITICGSTMTTGSALLVGCRSFVLTYIYGIEGGCFMPDEEMRDTKWIGEYYWFHLPH